jgi:hypothetical protein
VHEPDPLFRLHVPAPPEEVLAAVEDAAEDWGALWERGTGGGSLRLPVSAGLRHGHQRGRIDVTRDGAGTEVRFRVELSEYHLWAQAVVVLLIGVGGGALTVLWPFWPELLPVAPFGALMALSAWLLVVSRLRNRGAEEFLDTVGALIGGDARVDEEGAAGAEDDPAAPAG